MLASPGSGHHVRREDARPGERRLGRLRRVALREVPPEGGFDLGVPSRNGGEGRVEGDDFDLSVWMLDHAVGRNGPPLWVSAPGSSARGRLPDEIRRVLPRSIGSRTDSRSRRDALPKANSRQCRSRVELQLDGKRRFYSYAVGLDVAEKPAIGEMGTVERSDDLAPSRARPIKTLSSPRNGAFAAFVRPTPQSDPWRHDRGRIVS
jgi:hypothetical protein